MTRCRIRYTQPAALNDPFDSRPYLEKIAEGDILEGLIDETLPGEMRGAYDGLPAHVKSTLRYSDFEALAGQLREGHRGRAEALFRPFVPIVKGLLIENINRFLGILSLTEKEDSLLMWAHYAADHTGFVLGFDATNEYFDERRSEQDSFRHLRKVKYRIERPKLTLHDMDDISVFLVKSIDWKYEQEWRIVRAIPEAAETLPREPYPICLFDFPPEAVTEVILGARMTQHDRTRVIKAVKSGGSLGHARVLQAVVDDEKFKIRIEGIGINGGAELSAGAGE